MAKKNEKQVNQLLIGAIIGGCLAFAIISMLASKSGKNKTAFNLNMNAIAMNDFRKLLDHPKIKQILKNVGSKIDKTEGKTADLLEFVADGIQLFKKVS